MKTYLDINPARYGCCVIEPEEPLTADEEYDKAREGDEFADRIREEREIGE